METTYAKCAAAVNDSLGLAAPPKAPYFGCVIIVRFHDEATQKRALGFLIGRFSGHSWVTGEIAIPEEALVPMAREGIPFTVEGPATNERILSLRDSLAVDV
jgi:hypothetical protein